MSDTGSVHRSRLMTLAGTPTATACDGRSLTTTEPAPTLDPAPITTGPSTDAPAPSSTPWPTVGWRMPSPVPEPPRLTWCSIDTLSPTTAVSPITTPVAWSSSTPRPIIAPGWISTWKTCDARLCSASASATRPLLASQWATRWHWIAWKPLKYSKHWLYFSHAGSRSTQASKSATAASTMSGSRSYAESNNDTSCTAPSVVSSPSLLASMNASDFSRLACASTVEYRKLASAGSPIASRSASSRIACHSCALLMWCGSVRQPCDGWYSSHVPAANSSLRRLCVSCCKLSVERNRPLADTAWGLSSRSRARAR
mmetsp:Transcript_21868/g.65432  ORF Transcript_21868/g.65432 Transcript_21868/m.65432 type:complete len:313 (-) Transcript_21868:708-1646(-)